MSTRIVVEVVEVESVRPHPNAEKLDIGVIKGWQVVVPKGEYVAGDKVVYFPPDVVVPQAWSDQFGVTKYLSNGRVRCARLRGEPSFGFAIPADPDDEVGQDMADFYGVTKYEPPFRPTAGDAERDHPLFPAYTDVENLRNFPDILQSGELVSVTEKIHGTSARVAWIDGEWMAGSMRVRRKRPALDELRLNTYWYPLSLKPVIDLVEDFVGAGARQVVLYGEVYGPKIQSFGYGVKNGVGFAAFDLLVDGKFVDANAFADTCFQYGIQAVPLLAENVPYSLDMVKALSAGPATFGGGHIREGVVVKPMTERTDPRVGRVVLKYVADDYLLGNHTDFTEQ